MSIVLRVIGTTWEGIQTMHVYTLPEVPAIEGTGGVRHPEYYRKLAALAMNKPSRFCPDFKYVEDVQVRNVASNRIDLMSDGHITTTYDLVRCDWSLPTSKDHWACMVDE